MLKILWITNVELPEASKILGRSPSPFGGWLDLASKELASREGVSLSVASMSSRSFNVPPQFVGEKITYFLFYPSRARRQSGESLEERFSDIIERTDPDIVHIFGTELSHANTVVETCVAKQRNFVVSIQGLPSVIAQHYVTGLPVRVQVRSTGRDLIKRDNILQQQRKLRVRGIQEIAALQKTRHAIGRTSWDEACLSQINPEIDYYRCSEIMRGEFYGRKWHLDSCDRYTIFMSQGYYPIKGLHILLEAMPLILRRFPQARIAISGWPPVADRTLRARLRQSSYGLYIRQLIRKHRLEERVELTGILGAEEMRDRLLKAHVFALPSTIENSPNSLGEAMLLGVPCVASRVGGVPDLLEHGREGYTYQVDAPYMLAHYICRIFEDDECASRLSLAARSRASITHNPDANTRALEQIYARIIGRHEASGQAMSN